MLESAPLLDWEAVAFRWEYESGWEKALGLETVTVFESVPQQDRLSQLTERFPSAASLVLSESRLRDRI